MKNGKTPGSDGLPAEFHMTFFHLFGRDFIDMIIFCYLGGIDTITEAVSYYPDMQG